MIYVEYKFHELFTVEIIDPSKFPFNINFSRKRMENIKGPGLYFIMIDGEIAYLGSYKTDNDIIADRWIRYMHTITCRGINIGFGNKTIEWFKKTYSPLFIRHNITINETEIVNERLRDTGYVTTKSIVKYCMSKWNILNNMDNNLNLSFHLFKPDANNTKEFVKDIASIKKYLIQHINPPCNSQYKSKLETLKLQDAIDVIKKTF
jgi:hypothetical protein